MPGCAKWSVATATIVLFSCTVLHARQTQQLKLVVDRTTVRAGERVHLSIIPSALASQFPFAIGFQDGPIDVLEMGQTVIDHEYRTPGSYKISITSQEPIPEVSNNGIEVQVESLRLIAMPQSVRVGEPLDLTIPFRPPQDSATKYRFLFGDGSSTAWRDTPTITYSYESPETYFAQGEVLRPGWPRAISTAPVEIAVAMAAPNTATGEDQVSTSSGVLPWLFVLAALFVGALLASLAFAVYKTRQWLFPPRPTFEIHRGGVAGELEGGVPPQVILEVVLLPGVASGRHDLSPLEIKRARGERKKNG